MVFLQFSVNLTEQHLNRKSNCYHLRLMITVRYKMTQLVFKTHTVILLNPQRCWSQNPKAKGCQDFKTSLCTHLKSCCQKKKKNHSFFFFGSTKTPQEPSTWNVSKKSRCLPLLVMIAPAYNFLWFDFFVWEHYSNGLFVKV